MDRVKRRFSEVKSRAKTPLPDRMTAEQYRALQASGDLNRANRSPSGRAPSAGASPDPQAVLTQALRDRLGHDRVLSEVKKLIPGRAYRADIVIPEARLVIEFDGFQYHRSKVAFQNDRARQNLFVQQGWWVLRYFHAQVRDHLEDVVAQILDCMTLRGVSVVKESTSPAPALEPV